MIRALPLLLLMAGPVMAAEIHCPAPVVVDGDSIRCGEEPLRLVGFDCPETWKPKCPAEMNRGLAATRRLKELLATKPFRAVRSPKGKDRYGRTLALLYIDGENVADVMIRERLARILLYDHGEQRRSWCE